MPKSYIQSLFPFKIHVREEEPYLLRAVIQSRHVTHKKYIAWVEFFPQSQAQANWTAQQLVPAWMCTCYQGQRTLGCCAHITSVIWYLSFARYSGWKPHKPVWSQHVIDTRDDATMDSDEENPQSASEDSASDNE